jgi:hypothetical protein
MYDRKIPVTLELRTGWRAATWHEKVGWIRPHPIGALLCVLAGLTVAMGIMAEATPAGAGNSPIKSPLSDKVRRAIAAPGTPRLDVHANTKPQWFVVGGAQDLIGHRALRKHATEIVQWRTKMENPDE